MPKISMNDVKKLRETTGARILDCKKALDEAAGDFDQAKKIVEAKGLARAEKKQDRATSAGLIATYSHMTGKIGAIIELQCETDFVAKNEEFKTLARDIAMQVVAMNPEDVKELLAQEFIKDSTITIGKLIKSLSGKIGEKMILKRFQRFELGEE
jgi:elongation factor Ts